MQKTIYSIAVFAFILGLGFVSTPQRAEANVTCTLSATGPGQTLVYFDYMLLRSDQTTEGAISNFQNISLPAGEYEVTLDSFDEHSVKGGQNQYNEQWYVELYNDNSKITQTGTIDDLPENLDRITQVVNSSLLVSTNVNKIRTHHAFYPNSVPNSIVPVCALFERVDDDLEVGSCSVNASSLAIGQAAAFSVAVSGGTGSYSYSWTGSDGLSGSNSSVSKVYSSAGVKTASVTVTSVAQSISRSCSVVVVEPPDDDLVGSCSVTPASLNIGGTATWSATASGASGGYSYSWSGTDGLSGTSASVSKSYATSGTKTGSVTITSGSQSITRNCSTYVQPQVDEDLVGSCSVSPSNPQIGDSVNWSATASGGNGSFTYNWSGTNGLSGSNASVSKIYTSAGLKSAAVVITSGSQSITRNCSTYVEEEEENDLELYCTPDGGTYEVDERITWQAHATGGDGNYDYDWSGTDGLDGNSRTESIRYNTDGTKRANVTVHSGDGQTETATCRVYVEEEDNDDLNISCRVSDTRIEEGDRVTFDVNINGGNSPFDIEWNGDIDDIDNFDDNRQRQTVRIDDSGRYEIEVEVTDDDGNRDLDQCPVIVVSGNNVGVTVTSSTNNGQVAGVSLSQIPVTGITDNPVLNAILYSLAGLTLVVIGSVSLFILRKREVVPVGTATAVPAYTENEIASSLEDTAHKQRVIVSADAMEALMLRSRHNKVKALILLNEAIAKTKKNVSTDAWIVLSKQKMFEIL